MSQKQATVTHISPESSRSGERPRRASLFPPTPRQIHARARFVHHVERLREETRRGTAREHLDPIIELCEWLLDESGSGKIVDQYRTELGHAKAALAWRRTDIRGR